MIKRKYSIERAVQNAIDLLVSIREQLADFGPGNISSEEYAEIAGASWDMVSLASALDLRVEQICYEQERETEAWDN